MTFLKEILQKQSQLQQDQQQFLESVDQSSTYETYETAMVEIRDPISVTKRDGDLPSFVYFNGTVVGTGELTKVLACALRISPSLWPSLPGQAVKCFKTSTYKVCCWDSQPEFVRQSIKEKLASGDIPDFPYDLEGIDSDNSASISSSSEVVITSDSRDTDQLGVVDTVKKLVNELGCTCVVISPTGEQNQ